VAGTHVGLEQTLGASTNGACRSPLGQGRHSYLNVLKESDGALRGHKASIDLWLGSRAAESKWLSERCIVKGPRPLVVNKEGESWEPVQGQEGSLGGQTEQNYCRRERLKADTVVESELDPHKGRRRGDLQQARQRRRIRLKGKGHYVEEGCQQIGATAAAFSCR
jgi:hypothetical protein